MSHKGRPDATLSKQVSGRCKHSMIPFTCQQPAHLPSLTPFYHIQHLLSFPLPLFLSSTNQPHSLLSLLILPSPLSPVSLSLLFPTSLASRRILQHNATTTLCNAIQSAGLCCRLTEKLVSAWRVCVHVDNRVSIVSGISSNKMFSRGMVYCIKISSGKFHAARFKAQFFISQ